VRGDSQVKPRYPVYVISKGRYKRGLTMRFLARDGVSYYLVVEPQEADEYRKRYPEAELLVTPFSNLGQGSIPARNFVWEHSKERGDKRHWILDDNIRNVYRLYLGKRLYCRTGIALVVMEDFCDRYENIAIAGPNYVMFANAPNRPPFVLNVHVYSTLLILNDLTQRWRGRYNEDADLCLQVLSAGLCIVQFNAYLIQKMKTMDHEGGNTEELYKGDGRLKMARSLERVWPGVVSTDRRFLRPQHIIKDNWRKFDTKLIRRKDIDWDALKEPNEYGMRLIALREPRSERIRKLLAEDEKRHARS
jgi:hypothetical protein